MRSEVDSYSRQNKKPQVKAATKTQGEAKDTTNNGNSNSTTDIELREGKARYEKGMELYRQGKVSVTPNGMYKVNGYEVDLRTPVRCECPDYRNRKRACKHIFAALQFSKSGNGHKSENSAENVPEKPTDGTRRDFERNTTRSMDRGENTARNGYKDFDRQATITRLAVLNTATEILKTHDKPVEPEEVIFLASRLEAWAMGS